MVLEFLVLTIVLWLIPKFVHSHVCSQLERKYIAVVAFGLH